MSQLLKGRCLCGSVTYTVTGAPEKASACHCSQCRRQSGHIWASAQVDDAAIAIAGDTLVWYRSSDTAKRGFCSACGSYLFWILDGAGKTSFSLGSLDQPTRLSLEKHIFVADKGDYYAITDDLPQKD
ncbi:MAG: GFA family protein [Rhizobiales bacterium]|nr:GFA family protein [Hyphomicrobiales bacterium]MBO6699395.1 GFA family protein [Hyphomicrobiales bacterium]MBO6736933.1 GFA family protein [Hyphomicrobiales bacterium]MBO6911993.1 GFA family protein [Hyphomicrobiales bacterium]MBO6954639.1 GFA family protein [Hyphomicrobiales bacterium]